MLIRILKLKAIINYKYQRFESLAYLEESLYKKSKIRFGVIKKN